MGTKYHSLASKKRWQNISKPERRKRMSATSKKGWDALDTKARRRRALKGVRTRELKKTNIV